MHSVMMFVLAMMRLLAMPTPLLLPILGLMNGGQRVSLIDATVWRAAWHRRAVLRAFAAPALPGLHSILWLAHWRSNHLKV